MNCRETLPMLSGYMDGELDLVHRLEIERHLQSCPECANHVHNGREVQTVLKSDRLYYGAPRGLEGRVLSAVRIAERAERPRKFLRPAIGTVAFAALFSLIWLAFAHVSHTNREALVTQQVTCSHVRSLMANHLLDIASSDPLVVKSWFSGKIDYAPTVLDLSRQGYSLRGGRLDYVNDHTDAALVYQYQKHMINLFLWPTHDADTAIGIESRHGYHIARWTSGAMTYCAVSDLSADELLIFAEKLTDYENCNRR